MLVVYDFTITAVGITTEVCIEKYTVWRKTSLVP